jgi:hypothetical protein
MPWVYDPHSGGIKISPELQKNIRKEAEDFARSRLWYPKVQLRLRVKGQFCYIDTITKSDNRIFPLCRLRQKIKDRWSVANFTYSNEQYTPYVFLNGEHEGTFRDALHACEILII